MRSLALYVEDVLVVLLPHSMLLIRLLRLLELDVEDLALDLNECFMHVVSKIMHSQNPGRR